MKKMERMNKETRILAFSDLHAYPHKAGNQILENGRSSRLQDAIKILNHLYDQDEHHLYLFGGDLFHQRRRIDTDAFNAVNQALNPSRKSQLIAGHKRTLMIVGNHDQYNKAGTVHSLECLDRLGIDVVQDWEVHFYQGEQAPVPVLVAGVAYKETPELFQAALSNVLDASKGKSYKGAFRILLAHQGINGAKRSASDSYGARGEIELADLQPDEWDLILLGHYHLSQTLAPHIYYIGAPYQQIWGEANELRGYLDIVVRESDKPRKFLVSRHAVPEIPRFYVVSNKVDLGQDIQAGDWLRLVSDLPGLEQELEKLKQQGVHTEVWDKPKPAQPMSLGLEITTQDPKEVLKVYLSQQDLEDEEAQLLLQTGMEFLEGETV